jgi:HPt (histidine-containing phosphotransfer) domain-containing protein
MDIKRLSQELELGEDDCKELVDLFLDTGRADINEMKAALQKGNGQLLMRAAHSLKGAAANFNIMDISNMAAEIEKRAIENKLERVSLSIHTLETLFDKLSS